MFALSLQVNMLGKGQRGKKRITYDEDAMATAVYSKAQFLEESERKRPRRRKASSEEEQEVVAGPSAQVSVQPCPPSLPSSLPTDSISLQVNTASPSNVSDTEQLQGSSAGSVLPRMEVMLWYLKWSSRSLSKPRFLMLQHLDV
jgi:hypothetical protein